MGKISNTSGSSNIWLGSKANTQQAILYVPASSVAGGGTADKPGLLFLEAVDSLGALGGVYVWADSTNVLRYSSTYPTNEDGDGSALGTTTASSASRTLDNLATTTTINSSLVSDTDSTDDLGSSSAYWANAYIDVLYLTSTSTITGGSDVATFNGGITIGSDGDGHDLILYGETATQYIQWDMDYSTNAGGLLVTDNVILDIGTGHDVSFSSDGTHLSIVTATDDTIVKCGATHDLDWQWESYAIPGQDMGWIADIGTFQLCDDTILNIGGAAVLTADDGFAFVFIPGSTPSTLNLDPTNANDLFRVGETNVADVQFDGANYNIIWNASDNAYIFQDSAELTFGTALDIYMRWENTGETLDIGQTADGTGSVDFIDCPVLMTGADSAGVLLDITGIDTTVNSNSVNITHSGTGYALAIDVATTDAGAALYLLPKAAQTTSLMIIDGVTADWDGANDVGMVHIKSDADSVHIGSTLFLVTSSNILDDAEGGLARFLDTAAAGGGTTEYAVEIASTNNEALNVSAGLVNVTSYVRASGFQMNDYAATATATPGGSTDVIPDGGGFVTVTNADANKVITLPAPTPGTVVWIAPQATGYELISSTPADVYINGGKGSGYESDISANQTVRAVCVSSTKWIVSEFDTDGTEAAAPAAGAA